MSDRPTEDARRAMLADAFVRALSLALAQGPHAQDILAVARGTSRIVVKQHPDKSGWVIGTEPVDGDSTPA